MGGKDRGCAAETGWKAACGKWDTCFQANGVHVGMGGRWLVTMVTPGTLCPAGNLALPVMR